MDTIISMLANERTHTQQDKWLSLKGLYFGTVSPEGRKRKRERGERGTMVSDEWGQWPFGLIRSNSTVCTKLGHDHTNIIYHPVFSPVLAFITVGDKNTEHKVIHLGHLTNGYKLMFQMKAKDRLEGGGGRKLAWETKGGERENWMKSFWKFCLTQAPVSPTPQRQH